MSQSDDLLRWQQVDHVFSGRRYAWDELIGAGAPPIKTREGWLLIYYGVATHPGSVNVYQAGVILLDLENPARVISRGRYNLLEPREFYELTGLAPNVVFPSGAIVAKINADGFAAPDNSVFVYYGAADTCVGLALTSVGELLPAAFDQ